jgi:hypothetical protein
MNSSLEPNQVKNAFMTLGELATKGISSSTSTPLLNDSAPAPAPAPALTHPDETQTQPQPDTVAAANPVLNPLDSEDALNNQSASATPTMYNINGEPGVDAEDVAEEDKIFKYKNLEEVNTARQTKEMELLSKLKTGGRRRSRRRNNKKSAKKSAKRGGRKSAKKGGKKHRKSTQKGGRKRSYRKH